MVRSGMRAHGVAREPRPTAMTAEEIAVFLAREFPQMARELGELNIVEATGDHALVRLTIGERHLRPGGTVSGPTQFALADVSAYVAVLAAVGPKALAVTTSGNINFLKKPSVGDLSALCRILKHGKRLVVIDCMLFSDGVDDPVAHAVLTYSVPDK